MFPFLTFKDHSFSLYASTLYKAFHKNKTSDREKKNSRWKLEFNSVILTIFLLRLVSTCPTPHPPLPTHTHTLKELQLTCLVSPNALQICTQRQMTTMLRKVWLRKENSLQWCSAAQRSQAFWVAPLIEYGTWPRQAIQLSRSLSGRVDRDFRSEQALWTRHMGDRIWCFCKLSWPLKQTPSKASARTKEQWNRLWEISVAFKKKRTKTSTPFRSQIKSPLARSLPFSLTPVPPTEASSTYLSSFILKEHLFGNYF